MDIEQETPKENQPSGYQHIVPNFQKNAFDAKAIWSNTQRAKILIVVFWIIIIATMIGIALDFFELDLLNRIDQGTGFTMEEADDNDSRQLLAGIIIFIIRVISIVVFLNWFRRAYNNIIRMGQKADYSESTAAWSWFVPIMNLFVPVKIMTEINNGLQYQLHKMNVTLSRNGVSLIIGLWWAVHIINNIYATVVNRISLSAETASEMMIGTQNSIYSEILTIVEALLVIFMVYKISSMESRLEREYKKAGGSVYDN